MNCKIYQCQETAEHPYPCCSLEHGMKLKEIKGLIESHKKGDLTGWGQSLYEKLTPQELEYYSKI
jgi:hypothetical protein